MEEFLGKSHRKFLETLHSQFPKKKNGTSRGFFHGKTDGVPMPGTAISIGAEVDAQVGVINEMNGPC